MFRTVNSQDASQRSPKARKVILAIVAFVVLGVAVVVIAFAGHV
jgi:hypothetical protein